MKGGNGMKRKQHAYMVNTAILVAVLFSSCVKDDLYNTPHPDRGAVVVTADWSGRSGEAATPGRYVLRIDGQEQETGDETTALNRLLAPGDYTLAVYNTPDQISIDGNTASVSGISGGYVHPAPDYLFASTLDVNVQADDTLRVTAPMKQLVRRLDLELTATEGDYSRVRTATATLSGVASTVDVATGERGAAARAMNTFRQDGARFTLFFRLLGIVPAEARTLTVDITFTNGDTQQIVSDLTDATRSFNDGVSPMKLTGELWLPVELGVTGATIENWNDGGSHSGDAKMQ